MSGSRKKIRRSVRYQIFKYLKSQMCNMREGEFGLQVRTLEVECGAEA